MINFSRQAYANPFLAAVNAPFGVNPFNPIQHLGGFVPTPFAYLPMTQLGQYNPLAAQVAAGIVPGINPFGMGQGVNPMTLQFGQNNPLLSQVGGINPLYGQFGQANPFAAQPGGLPWVSNPFIGQSGGNWPGQQYQQGFGAGTGAYGIDPRISAGVGQQLGYTDPNVILGLMNPALTGNQMGSQQINPLFQQQLPIRPLINSPQVGGFQSNVPGVGIPTAQWNDPYRAFIEAQLISQLATNPLYQLQHQLQRGYGGPETAGLGTPFGTSQQFNPLYGNVPFCG